MGVLPLSHSNNSIWGLLRRKTESDHDQIRWQGLVPSENLIRGIIGPVAESDHDPEPWRIGQAPVEIPSGLPALA